MKKRVLFTTALAVAVLCSGCAGIPDMTAEQNNAVAEYAASALIERSYSYRARYVDDLEPLTEAETEDESESESESESAAINPSEAETEAPVDFDIAKDMGLEGVKVSYGSYKIAEEYPDDPDALFSFEPQDGYSFLVVSLDITNTGTEAVTLNNSDKTNIIKLRIGNKGCNNYANLLNNDITNLKGVTIEAGASFESIVIFMVQDDILNDMNEFTLSTDEGESITVKP